MLNYCLGLLTAALVLRQASPAIFSSFSQSEWDSILGPKLSMLVEPWHLADRYSSQLIDTTDPEKILKLYKKYIIEKARVKASDPHLQTLVQQFA